jgi:excinuclease ABC subunit C
MELTEKVAAIPDQPGVYLFKDALGSVLYVGKARALRHRLKSYFLDSRIADAKTGSLVREIADVDYIVVDNEKEALALENHLIKRHQPKFNILLRDDKTYPYIRYTAPEKYPRVYVTRRLRKDGAIYFGPYFPHSLAHRIVDLIHKRFLVPSCTVDLTRAHPRPCLQYYIKRCLGPCVPGLTTDERYAQAARDVKLFLEGRRRDLLAQLEARMGKASDEERFEEAAAIRDQMRVVRDVEERQKIAAAEGDDTDVLAWHAEPPLVAVNLFHMRGGRVVDRRDFYWEGLEEFDPAEFLASLLKQVYLDAGYRPRYIHVPMEFDDRAVLEDLLTERSEHRVEILVPQRGPKRAFLDLVQKNAKHSFDQRFRVLKPTSKAIAEALESALNLPETPKRIESFDISHIQGTDTVASMVVWEDGRMKKSDYRKFIIRGVTGADDFASMREAVERRYRRLQEEKKPLPELILIDGGIGQLHAAGQALERLEIINQPLASIAKKEEVIYVQGQEDEPVRLERHSPILHLVQQIRDETHRFAVTFHRQRRGKSRLRTELVDIPGVGERTAQKLLRRFGSVVNLRRAPLEELERVVPRAQARRVFEHFQQTGSAEAPQTNL